MVASSWDEKKNLDRHFLNPHNLYITFILTYSKINRFGLNILNNGRSITELRNGQAEKSGRGQGLFYVLKN